MIRSGLSAGSRVVHGRTCGRCHGFMVPGYTDSLLVEIRETPPALSWRCVNCGEWIDATVVMNREHLTGSEPTTSRTFSPVSRRRWRW